MVRSVRPGPVHAHSSTAGLAAGFPGGTRRRAAWFGRQAAAAALAGLMLDPPLRESLGLRGRRRVLSTHDVRRAAESSRTSTASCSAPRVPPPGRRFRAAGRAKAPGTGHGRPPSRGAGAGAAARISRRPAPVEYMESTRS
ncbi:hypothetical protein ACF1A5_23875 [Streptomyces sp. NPDC014864]|uniref:hypothetical protein n=1 Tax=Streptomyces sp. NPDC014864 TaxID=3364924 RepID=UPI0036FF652B